MLDCTAGTACARVIVMFNGSCELSDGVSVLLWSPLTVEPSLLDEPSMLAYFFLQLPLLCRIMSRFRCPFDERRDSAECRGDVWW